jgi:hypothetical protein
MLSSARAVVLAIGFAASCIAALTPTEKQADNDDPYAGMSLDYDGISFGYEVWCPGNNLDCPFPVAGDDWEPSPDEYTSIWRDSDIPAVDLDEHVMWAKWKNSDPEYPVVLEWRVGEGSMRWNEEKDSLILTSNITATHNATTENDTLFRLSLPELLESAMDNSTDPKLTAIVGRILAARTTYFRVLQPDRPTAGLDLRARWGGKGRPFAALTNQMTSFLFYEQQDRKNIAKECAQRWKLTIGLCLGLALPLAATVAFLTGRFTARQHRSDMHSILVSEEKAGFQYPQVHRVSSYMRRMSPFSRFK